MVNIPMIVAKTGAGLVIGGVAASTTFGRVIKPITDTFGTVGRVVAEGNEHTRRVVETRQIERKSNDLILRMQIENGQRKALIDYGNQTVELNNKFNSLPQEAQNAISEWQKQFPDVI